MALAIVVCQFCRAWVNFGEEKYVKNRPACSKCYKDHREGAFDDMIERSQKPLKTKKRRKRRKKKWVAVDPDEL